MVDQNRLDTRVKKRLGVSCVQSVTKMVSEKRRMKFSVEEELRLIHEVQKRPVLEKLS